MARGPEKVSFNLSAKVFARIGTHPAMLSGP